MTDIRKRGDRYPVFQNTHGFATYGALNLARCPDNLLGLSTEGLVFFFGRLKNYEIDDERSRSPLRFALNNSDKNVEAFHLFTSLESQRKSWKSTRTTPTFAVSFSRRLGRRRKCRTVEFQYIEPCVETCG